MPTPPLPRGYSLDNAPPPQGYKLDPVVALPPGYTMDAVPQNTDRAAGKRSSGAPVPPPSRMQKLFGRNPVGDTLGNVVDHAENFVAGPYHALVDPADPNDPIEKSLGSPLEAPTKAVYRMTAKPTVDALRNATDALKRGDYGFGLRHSDYDANGQYRPSVASSALDAIPLVGPWARSIETDAVQKGILPAIAGAATDAAVPDFASRVLRVPALVKRAAIEKIVPTEHLDTPAPGDTLSPRERWQLARDKGVNLDLAQATKANIPMRAKKLTENSLLGGPRFAANNGANVNALHAYTQGMLDKVAPKISKEDFGNQLQDVLRKHQSMLDDEAGHGRYAQAMLDGLHEEPMTREEFGNSAKQALMAHQQTLNAHASGLFDGLDSKVGNKSIKTGGVQSAAQKILDENADYYAKHPTLMRGGVRQAWDLLQDLAGLDDPTKSGNAPSASGKSAEPVHSFGDLQRLRSDLMQMYQSPEIVGSRSEGWLKQMTAAIDDSMTSAGNGLKPSDRAQFRQANDTWARMKATYDNSQNPLYHVLRAPDGLTAANTLDKAKPETVRQVQQAATETNNPALMDQYRRQTAQRLLDPANNGEFDLDGYAGRFNKAQKDQLGAIMLPEHMDAMQELADKTSSPGPYDQPASKLYKVLKAEDGTRAADVLGKPTPETARQIAAAANAVGDTSIVPQMQRQTMSRILNPASNELPDLKNLPSQFTRADKEQLGGVLTPEQLSDMDGLAETSRSVNFDDNPAGTAKILQPVGEMRDLLDAGKRVLQVAPLTSGVGAAVSHGAEALPSALAGAGAVLADSYGRRAVAKAMTSPAKVDAVMGPRPPVPPAKLNALAAAQQVGAVQQNADQIEDTPTSAGLGTSDGNWGTPPPDKPGMMPLPKGNPAPPPGATHEVLHPSTGDVIGHVVDQSYIPLGTSDSPSGA